MTKIGEIKEIWRYPVKGMAGEPLISGRLGEQGLDGDRIWALRDLARKEIQS
ncbi:MOSC N-terminal beta barrel domain-containing protein [Acidihalobacter yilgarnensis]|uniref:MOSC N-terminal beta barrel domain-containing protein n=1 Tax=Acidihalobacter yilgarnensis TaxID=2819280 RepID=UPI0018D36779|nr:MOSC N-terminal beta barrel domain-containing protein [Acidihalobacter yilgarnensis]